MHSTLNHFLMLLLTSPIYPMTYQSINMVSLYIVLWLDSQSSVLPFYVLFNISTLNAGML